MGELGREAGLATSQPAFCHQAELPPMHTYLQRIAVRLKNGLMYVEACHDLQHIV